ncbi:hypothetical protein P8C59_007094 [Phyllachora maydis]|uniref:Uncharacterized protein n=1 Tax=Phyllachora maydis TaxID=1825666 RepID=A0AAD9I8T9_9PEZI|nr:hypothetical protein P8C59_007094 [Phyllachora maydis]
MGLLLCFNILEESRNPAIEAYRAAHVANSSNSTPNLDSNPSKKGKNKKKGSYNLAIEEEEESDSSFNSSSSSDSNTQSAQLLALKDFKKSGFFLDIQGSSKPILHVNFAFPLGLTIYNTTKSIEPQRNKIVVEIPSDSIRKEDYRPIIEDAIVSEAIEPKKRYKLRNSLAKGTTLEVATNNTALEGELVDLDLDLEGAISPDPSNLNTKKPISIEIGPSKLEPYESSSDSELDEPLPEPIFTPRPIEVIAPNQPITNEHLDNSDLISEGDKMQLDYYKLLAKTSSYILSFVYKARKRVISKDSTPTTYKQVLKLPRDERSKWLEAITKEFIQLLELGVFKVLPRSLLPSNCKLITCRNVLKVKKDAKNRPIKYKSRLVARGFM